MILRTYAIIHGLCFIYENKRKRLDRSYLKNWDREMECEDTKIYCICRNSISVQQSSKISLE